MASQPLAAVSRCQELDSSMGPSTRRTAGSLLTTSKRIASIVFCIKVGRSFPKGGQLFHELQVQSQTGSTS